MNASDYDPAAAALLVPTRLMEIGPGEPNESARAAIAALRLPPACMAGVWLLHDFLDESHAISQDIATPDGSFWHAVMHRREPDAANSKYWFRRVGDHPVLKLLGEQAPALGYPFTGPFAFVDFVERVRGTGSPDEELAKKVQLLEWELLSDHCLRAAT